MKTMTPLFRGKIKFNFYITYVMVCIIFGVSDGLWAWWLVQLCGLFKFSYFVYFILIIDVSYMNFGVLMELLLFFMKMCLFVKFSVF